MFKLKFACDKCETRDNIAMMHSGNTSDMDIIREMETQNNEQSANTQTGASPLVNINSTSEQYSGPQTLPQVTLDTASELDDEMRSALGVPSKQEPIFGDNIHNYLPKILLPILENGLAKEYRANLLNGHKVPNNCRFLHPPTLNSEIAAAVTEEVQKRDHEMELRQGQLGLGITAISKAMTVLLSNKNTFSPNKTVILDVIRLLSEGCKILSDLHFTETQVRTKLIRSRLDDPLLLDLTENIKRNETLFGKSLPEKISFAKSREQKLNIHLHVPMLPEPSVQHQTERPRQAGQEHVLQENSHVSSNVEPVASTSAAPDETAKIEQATSSKRTRTPKASTSGSFPGIHHSLWQALNLHGYSQAEIEKKIKRLSPSTLKTYNTTIELWHKYCNRRNYNWLEYKSEQVVQFLGDMHKAGATFITMKRHRTVLSLFFDKKIVTDKQVSVLYDLIK